ncbi:MAG: transposase [Cyanobacteria bacterium P01_C01_bin.121]
MANRTADADSTVLRLSIASKAKVKVGNLSRGGKDRRQSAPQADDHDTEWQSVVVPFGILNLQTDALALYLGESAETPDFIVDCLNHWWQEHRVEYRHIATLAINLDSGGATRSNRTQFIKRMVSFARQHQLRLELIYYPPYHSKYNPIERCWAALEQFWNGAILDSIETTLQWASNMSWKGVKPVVNHVTGTYEKGIKVDAQTLASFQVDWHPSAALPKWAIMINPG